MKKPAESSVLSAAVEVTDKQLDVHIGMNGVQHVVNTGKLVCTPEGRAYALRLLVHQLCLVVHSS